jgi:hypothetical protein
VEQSAYIGTAGVALFILFVTLLDAFETVILPRRVTRAVRPARLFFRTMWRIWFPAARHIRKVSRRETYLSYYGPLALLLLFGFWAGLLVLSFAMLQWAAGSAIGPAQGSPSGGFLTDLYLSGTTFFTLGMGDVVPLSRHARALSVLEAGLGFGFLAILISYLPTLYTAFSQREVNISILDARAGSPPTAGELLRRHGQQRIRDGLGHYLREWETWAAQLMESHLTYPVLCFFRSQHANQSWVAAFTAILDICSLLIAYGEGEVKWHAQLTFATARHAVADLAEVLKVAPIPPHPDRLPAEDLAVLRSLLVQCGVPGCTDAGDAKLTELRGLYEPLLNGLSRLMMMPLPPWGAHPPANRPGTIWGRITGGGEGINPTEQPNLTPDSHRWPEQVPD